MELLKVFPNRSVRKSERRVVKEAEAITRLAAENKLLPEWSLGHDETAEDVAHENQLLITYNENHRNDTMSAAQDQGLK